MQRRNMLYSTVVLLVFAAFCNCAADGDVMARYGGRAITRGMLVRWLQGRSDDVDVVMSRKEEQRRKLKRLALELITVEEAKKAGYDRSDDFRFLLRYVERSFCADYYWSMLSREGWFEGDVVRVREFTLSPGTGPDADALARKIIGELRAGASMEAVTKSRGRRVAVAERYRTRGDQGDAYDRAVFTLGPGEVAPDPIIANGNTVVVMVLERHHPDRDTIGDSIGDSGERRALRKSLLSRARDGLESRLLGSEGVWDNTAMAASADPAAVLYRVPGEQCTVSDLERILRLVYLKKNGALQLQGISAKIRQDWARNILLDALLFHEAERRGIRATEEYREHWAVNRQHSLTAGYLDDVVLAAVTATENEARRDYDRMIAITLRARKKGIVSSAGSGIVPFHKAKHDILLQIRDKKRMDARLAWEAKLLARERFTIMESELSGF